MEGNHYLALAPSQRNIIIMYYSVINMYHRKDSAYSVSRLCLSWYTHSPRYNLFNIYPTFLQVTHIDIRSVDVIRVRNSIFRFQNYSVMVICNNEKNHLTIICSRIVSKWYRESSRLTGYNAGVLVFFNVSFSGSRSGRLNLCLFDGIVEFQLEKHGVFTTLNTVFLKVTDWNRLGVEPNRRLVILGC